MQKDWSTAQRRSVVVAVIAAEFVALMAAPSLAQQRDPFDPLVNEGTSTGATTVATTQVTDTTTVQTGAGQAQADDTQAQQQALPYTGLDVAPWVMLAVMLMVSGGAVVLLSTKLGRPPAL